MMTLPATLLTLAALALAVSPAAGRSHDEGYAGCSYSDNCISFDLVTYAIGDTIDLLEAADYPYDATMRPGGNEIWLCGASGDSLIVIDRASNAISHRIPVGEYPNSIVFTDNDSLALVSARDGDLVTLVSTSTYSSVGTLDVTTGSGGSSDGPGNMALDPVSGRIYAVDWYGDTLYEIAPDGSAVLNSATVGGSLWQLVVDPWGRYVYITDRGADVVRVIDQPTLTQVREVVVGDDPWGIDVTLDGAQLVVACEDDHNVYVIDTSDWSTVVIALDPAADPRDVDILDESKYAFIAGGQTTTANPLYIVELTTVSLKDAIDLPGSNVNVVAVQQQMTSAVTGIVGPAQTGALELSCFPNPFNPVTTIRYNLPRACDIKLAVYDAPGRLVARLDESFRERGEHEAVWNGRDRSGVSVAAGVYFVRLTADDEMATEKIVLVE